MDPFLASPFPSTAQISNHEVLPPGRPHSIEPLEPPIKSSNLHKGEKLNNNHLRFSRHQTRRISIFYIVHDKNVAQKTNLVLKDWTIISNIYAVLQSQQAFLLIKEPTCAVILRYWFYLKTVNKSSLCIVPLEIWKLQRNAAGVSKTNQRTIFKVKLNQ